MIKICFECILLYLVRWDILCINTIHLLEMLQEHHTNLLFRIIKQSLLFISLHKIYFIADVIILNITIWIILNPNRDDILLIVINLIKGSVVNLAAIVGSRVNTWTVSLNSQSWTIMTVMSQVASCRKNNHWALLNNFCAKS